ncbi:MAG: hypothetical protein F2840_15975 [Actinobacteria bacterium]|jgi:hypothetical protein|uniref:Unannotated protein n=1 Tax=freshwater metagenome TaxID=449393 RepID=A0A6J7LMK9_9ZZZZ|nr:hypothetical protein [Actinomycetota bacterium]
MWAKLRETVAGFTEQMGIEIPGLDAGADALAGLADSAETLVSDVVPEGVATAVTDVAGGSGV